MERSAFEIFTEDEWQEIANGLRLSTRKAEILSLVFRAQTDREIARHLSITVPTVRTHLRRLYQQLSVANRLELVLSVMAYFRAHLAC